MTMIGPNLEKIQAQLWQSTLPDDLINPPSWILEREIKRVPHGHAIVIPRATKPRGTAATPSQL